jgi:hypothetical protein
MLQVYKCECGYLFAVAEWNRLSFPRHSVSSLLNLPSTDFISRHVR